MSSNEVHWCEVCGDFYTDSNVEMASHIMDGHSPRERLNALQRMGPRPEDTDVE